MGDRLRRGERDESVAGREAAHFAISVPSVLRTDREDKLLLVIGINLLIKGAQVLVLLGFEQRKRPHQGTRNRDRSSILNNFRAQISLVSPRDARLSWYALYREARRKLIDDLVDDLLPVVHIDRSLPLALIYERFVTVNFKEETRKE